MTLIRVGAVVYNLDLLVMYEEVFSELEPDDDKRSPIPVDKVTLTFVDGITRTFTGGDAQAWANAMRYGRYQATPLIDVSPDRHEE